MNLYRQLVAASNTPEQKVAPQRRTGPQARRVKRVRLYHSAFKELGGIAGTSKVAAVVGQHSSSVGATLKEFSDFDPPLVKMVGKLPKYGPGNLQSNWKWLINDEMLDKVLNDMFQ